MRIAADQSCRRSSSSPCSREATGSLASAGALAVDAGGIAGGSARHGDVGQAAANVANRSQPLRSMAWGFIADDPPTEERQRRINGGRRAGHPGEIGGAPK